MFALAFALCYHLSQYGMSKDGVMVTVTPGRGFLLGARCFPEKKRILVFLLFQVQEMKVQRGEVI